MIKSSPSQKRHDVAPIFVGVTGKRRFAAEGAAHQEQIDRFENQLRRLVAKLDRDLPHTPKALICGGAAGTDLAAVRVILESWNDAASHPLWSVVIMLPFEMALFAEDFAKPEFQNELTFLRGLQENNRVIFKQLRPLADGPNGLAPADYLSRTSPRYDHKERSRHYEQLGAWLARNVTILIAAMPEETARLATAVSLTDNETGKKAAQVGGTARVVAHRRAGDNSREDDDETRAVIARSSALTPVSPLLEMDGGYVFWFDPGREVDADPDYQLLRPIQDMFDVREAQQKSKYLLDQIYRTPWQDSANDKPEHDRRYTGALRLAFAFERMNARRLDKDAPLTHAVFGPEHPAAFLEDVRAGELQRQQTDAAWRVRRIQQACALLFLLSVVTYETYTELAEYYFAAIAAYVPLLAVIAYLSSVLEHRKIQLRAEDYRGVREILRVQIAWWAAGIAKMADGRHLRTVDSNLRLVREAAKTCSLWALLRCRSTRTLDLAADASMAHLPKKWVTSQIDYFRKNSRLQAQSKRIAELVSKITFGAAMAGLGTLAFAEMFNDTGESILEWSRPGASLVFMVLAIPTAGMILQFLTGTMLGRGGRLKVGSATLASLAAVFLILAEAIRMWAPGWTMVPSEVAPHGWGLALYCGAMTMVVASRFPWASEDLDVQPVAWRPVWIATGLLAALSLITATVLADHYPFVQESAFETFRGCILAQSVFLLGVAGTIRWYTTRRNHSAQATHYDDMLRTFRRMEDLLEDRSPPYDVETRQYVIELGEMALDENEAWLKAHRSLPPEAPG